ncbi:MAG: iron-containing alcohol dehydrogenase [Bacillota bacterium]
MNRAKIQSLKNISAEHLSGIQLYLSALQKSTSIGAKIHTETGSLTRLLGISKSCGEGEILVLSQDGLENFEKNIIKNLADETVSIKRLERGASVSLTLASSIASAITASTKIIIATGGGVVCDISKIVANICNLPLCFVPSAPTSDGTLSPFAMAISDGTTKMIPAKAPDFVVCDASACVDIPAKLVRAGFGDVVSNYLAIFDWMVARDFGNTEFAEEIAYIAISSADKAIFAAETYLQNKEHGIELMFDAVLLSSGAMALAKKNSPCCGGEHSVAIALSKLAPQNFMHGELVFYCFCKLTEIYATFFSSFSKGKYLPPDTFARCDFLIANFDMTEEQAELACKMPISEDEYKIMKEKYRVCRLRYLTNIKKLQKKLPKLKALFFSLHDSDIESFKTDGTTFSKALGIAPDIEDKFTTLTIMREFGVLDSAVF